MNSRSNVGGALRGQARAGAVKAMGKKPQVSIMPPKSTKMPPAGMAKGGMAKKGKK